MTIKETCLERSTKYAAALELREYFDPENPADIQVLWEAYQASLILLEPLRLRSLRLKDMDHRFLEILEFVLKPYHHLVSQHGLEYFDRIRKLENASEFPELGLLRVRKHDLVEKWKETYSRKPANVEPEGTM